MRVRNMLMLPADATPAECAEFVNGLSAATLSALASAASTESGYRIMYAAALEEARADVTRWMGGESDVVFSDNTQGDGHE